MMRVPLAKEQSYYHKSVSALRDSAVNADIWCKMSLRNTIKGPQIVQEMVAVGLEAHQYSY